MSKSVKSIGKKVADPLNILGAGKSKAYKADALAGDINALGASGLRDFIAPAAKELNEKYYSNPEAAINNQIGIENKLIRGASDDAARRTQELIARRGLGNSSIGIGQEVNAAKQLNDKLALNNASALDRIKDLQNERMQLGSNLFGLKTAQGPIQMNTIKQRVGGITGQGGLLDRAAPFAGAAATAYAGRNGGAGPGK